MELVHTLNEVEIARLQQGLMTLKHTWEKDGSLDYEDEFIIDNLWNNLNCANKVEIII